MGDNKEIKKPGLGSRFLMWLSKSILFGIVGAFLLGLIAYGLRKLHAPLLDILVNSAGLSRDLSNKILVVAAAVFWVVFIGNIIMYFRGVKRS